MQNKRKLFDILNNYFDKIYVVTLRKSKDRHEHLKQELDGLNYTFFWGVNGKELNVDELQRNGIYQPLHTRFIKQLNGRKTEALNGARIGCALSHVGVYKEILHNNYSRTLILEDDLFVCSKTPEKLEKSLQELPDDWELFYLGHYWSHKSTSLKAKLWLTACKIVSSLRFRKYDPKAMRGRLRRPYSDHLERSGYQYGTHAYAVTPAGAKKILEFQTPVIQESDNAIASLCQNEWINAYNSKPSIFCQNTELPSTIRVRR